jgi:hypothetical protein
MQLNKSHPENDFDAFLKQALQIRQEPQRPEFTSKIVQQIKLQEIRDLFVQTRRQFIIESLLYLAAAIVLLALAVQYHNTLNQLVYKSSEWLSTAMVHTFTYSGIGLLSIFIAFVLLVACFYDLWEQDYL